jgi:hypothetical protein
MDATAATQLDAFQGYATPMLYATLLEALV